MPSPFPGMDPYLESPNHWPNVHHGLISEIQAKLTPVIRPRYLAIVEERVYVEDFTDPHRAMRVPDMADVPASESPRRQTSRAGGGVATLEITEPIVARADERLRSLGRR